MSWEMHEAAKKIADGWYSELEENRKRNAVLGRENAKLRELVSGLEWCTRHSGCNEGDELCPLYKSDAAGDKRYGCEVLESELGVGVDNGGEP